jgi:hypothetical protein
MNNNSKIYIKMFFYFIVTTLMTFATLLDTIDTHTINTITAFDWIKLSLKAIVPSLMTIKAFIDPSINDLVNSNNPEKSEK